MFKGLVAFVTSGALLNPVILIGVVMGVIMGVRLEFETFINIYKSSHMYLLALCVSALYNLIFNRVYKESGHINYGAIFENVIVFAIKFVLANVFSYLFMYMIGF